MYNTNRIVNNGSYSTDGIIKHGYQPISEGKPLNEGYVPTGVTSHEGTVKNTTSSNPPSGGTVQQDD